jgi:hypothetical protein
MPPQSMDSCLPCGACQLAPAFESGQAERSDHPVSVAPTLWMWPQDESRDAQQPMPADAIRPPVALRIRYCRWLN